jgi:D-aminoacyl-tRNA deacylase
VGETLVEMKTVIVCSVNDPAGSNIRDRLLESYPFRSSGKEFDSNPTYTWDDKVIVSSRKDIVFVENLDETYNNCRYIFISRHRAESGIPSLTAHFTGNFGTAAFGGYPNEIARFSPDLLKNYLLALNKMRDEIGHSYNITLEATHHGPTSLASTVMFVELGSTEREWQDKVAAKFIAVAIVSSLDNKDVYPERAIGIGGTHYPEKLNKIELESKIALGPIVPKYALEYFDRSLVDQMLLKSDGKIAKAIVDQKGLGPFKKKVMEILSQTKLEIVSL